MIGVLERSAERADTNAARLLAGQDEPVLNRQQTRRIATVASQ
jgi:hypothetical protein